MAIKKDIDPDTPIKIYALIDPRSEDVRYVGWTYTSLNRRLSNHTSEARNGKRNHRCNWIRGLLNEELVPIITSLEETTYESREPKEQYWIKYYGRENLTNGTEGGEGMIGWIPSEEYRDNMSKILKEKHAEDRILGNISWKIGYSLSEEHKEKLRKSSKKPNLNKTFSKETKQKMSDNHADVNGMKNPSYGKKKEGSSSKFYGVRSVKNKNRWVANISTQGLLFTLKSSKDEMVCATAYDLAAIFYYGVDCKLNFPELRENYISYLNQYEISDIKELRQIIKDYISQGGLN